MSFFTVLRDVWDIEGLSQRFVIVAGAVEAESPMDAVSEVVGDQEHGGPGLYLVVEVKEIVKVKAATTFSMEPGVAPPGLIDVPEAGGG